MKQLKFGEMNNELKPGEGVKIDEQTKYEYGADLNTEGTRIEDTGLGKAVVIRLFEFAINPDVKELPDKQTLFNLHSKQISTILWGDGLVPLEDNSPRVIIDAKQKKYQIFVPCEARVSTVFAEKPKNLSEELSKEAKNRKLDPKNT